MNYVIKLAFPCIQQDTKFQLQKYSSRYCQKNASSSHSDTKQSGQLFFNIRTHFDKVDIFRQYLFDHDGFAH